MTRSDIENTKKEKLHYLFAVKEKRETMLCDDNNDDVFVFCLFFHFIFLFSSFLFFFFFCPLHE